MSSKHEANTQWPRADGGKSHDMLRKNGIQTAGCLLLLLFRDTHSVEGTSKSNVSDHCLQFIPISLSLSHTHESTWFS